MLLDRPQPCVQRQALEQTGRYIASQQRPDGAIPWYRNGLLDPWDHIEAAMGLSTAGMFEQAARAYQWLMDNQLADGSWYANYFGGDAQAIKQSHFTAYIATGVWHHFLTTGDIRFLARLFPCIDRAVAWTLELQHDEGDIAWAVDAGGRIGDDALLTGCSSILRSLDCAWRMAQLLNRPRPHWHRAGTHLLQAVKYKPQRFDRSWPSKRRFAMDWFYPILGGALDATQAALRLRHRWAEFVRPGLGCCCVNDEPWVTMAETCELVIALCAAQQRPQAAEIFTWLEQWRAHHGAYPTGFVYTDATVWPSEAPTWTAAAVLLAADALAQLTPAHNLFIQTSIFNE